MAKLGKEARKRRGRAPKVIAASKIEKSIVDANGVLFADNLGLSVEQATQLRVKAREAKVVVKVVKNTLLKRVLESRGYDVGSMGKMLKGPTMIFAGQDDPVSPAKLLVGLVKDMNGKIAVKGGYFEGRAMSAADVDALSKTASREEMLGRLCGSLLSPATKVVLALNQAVGKVVYATDAHRRKLEEGQGSAA